MKNLKLLGVLLVSFMVMGLNVFAETEKIVLDAERTTAIEIAANAEAEIDLNNQKLTVADGHAIIVNEGATVTIKGNGEVNAKRAAVLNKGGNVTIEGGSYSSLEYYSETFTKILGVSPLTYRKFTRVNSQISDDELNIIREKLPEISLLLKRFVGIYDAMETFK